MSSAAGNVAEGSAAARRYFGACGGAQSTMALATQHAPLGVICGAMCAHALANCIAVIGGEMLGNALSEKYMAVAGGVTFLFFGAASLYEGITHRQVPVV